jgi:hypothetical protein
LTVSLTIEYKSEVQTKRVYAIEMMTKENRSRKVLVQAILKQSIESDEILAEANAIMLKHPTLTHKYASKL